MNTLKELLVEGSQYSIRKIIALSFTISFIFAYIVDLFSTVFSMPEVSVPAMLTVWGLYFGRHFKGSLDKYVETKNKKDNE